MINIDIVEDTLKFPKSPWLSSKDENWASYEFHKLGDFEEIHEVQIGQLWNFELVSLIFGVQTWLPNIRGPLSPFLHGFDFYLNLSWFYLT